MQLIDKIKAIHSELDDMDFAPGGSILLRNDSDGRGDYIAKWEHPTLARPTQEQLDGVSE